MIIVKLISGLGNQLFEYAVGRQLSLQRQVPLKLDISFFEGQRLRSYKLNHYNIQAEIATEKEIEKFTNIYNSNSLYARIFRKTESMLPKRKKLHYIEDEWWMYESELLKASSNVYVDGYWQHYKYYENLSPHVLQELTVKDPPSVAYSKYLTHLLSDNHSVSIHIRRGDYITDPAASKLMGILPLEYYHKAISYMEERLGSPSFYIFSDDLSWAKDNLAIQAPVTFVELENEGSDYFELELMSKCRHNIIANSTFSWWGAFLNRNKEKIVISPADWVLEKNINQKIQLQFPSWIKL